MILVLSGLKLLLTAAILNAAILFAPFATKLWRYLCKLAQYHCCQAKAHSDHAAFQAAIAAAESKPVPTYKIRRSQSQFVFF
jgi:hypothetical protein